MRPMDCHQVLVTPTVIVATSSNAGMSLSMSRNDNNGDDGDDDKNNNDKDDIDFLDRQFFDPSNVKDGSAFKWFADMVEQDYETAEALFASATIALLVLVSQELLRFYVHGDHYVPFKTGGSLW